MTLDITINKHIGLNGFGITVYRFIAYITSFFFSYYVIGIWGNSYAKKVKGFEIGNRYRLRSVMRLELIMVYLSVIIYLHLFSYFHTMHTKTLRNITDLTELRRKCFILFMVIMIGAHITYFFYFTSFEIPYIIFWPSALSLGIWMHLTFFTLFFMFGNAFVSLLILTKYGKEFVNLLCKIKLFNNLITNRKIQVLTTIILTIIMSLIQWYSSDKVVIKTIDLKLNNYPKTSNPMNFVLLTDLHGGAMVYKEQISNVVDKTNLIESTYNKKIDAIFIVGDAIDAPKELIENRMEPLKYLKSRLGTYFVSGNHEFYYGNYNDWKELFINNYGIHVLENDVEHLDDSICLVGLHDISSYKAGIVNVSMDESAISKCQRNESVVVLAHNPAATKRIMHFANISGHHVDLILSGHTHGGQYYILVPYVYWLLPYLYGLYNIQYDTTQLFVSAGTLYQAAPMKMIGRSEIWLITVS